MNDSKWLLCSFCFQNEGLVLGAKRLGQIESSKCSNCGRSDGYKLNKEALMNLAHQFFVWGSLQRCAYGAAPVIQFNDKQKTSITLPYGLKNDVQLFEKKLGVGFFYYGPRLWMVGEVEPLKNLQSQNSCKKIITRIINEYPTESLGEKNSFYRVRKYPKKPQIIDEYDSPPNESACEGRLNSTLFPVLYASTDLEVCVHECRFSAEDEIYVATLNPTRDLKLLNLTTLLEEEDASEFESLDMAVHMLFLAGDYSYSISQRIAEEAKKASFDGIIYPSYYSLLRTGTMPFETAYGISLRSFPKMKKYEEAKVIKNLAIFGRPIKERKVSVKCINRLHVSRVKYDFHFGPVGV